MRLTQSRPQRLPQLKRRQSRRRRPERPRAPPPAGDPLRRAGVQRLPGLVRAGVRLLPPVVQPLPGAVAPRLVRAVRLLPAVEILQVPGP